MRCILTPPLQTSLNKYISLNVWLSYCIMNCIVFLSRKGANDLNVYGTTVLSLVRSDLFYAIVTFRRSNKDRKRMPYTFFREYTFVRISIGWGKIMIDTNYIEWKNIVYRLGGERFYRTHKSRLIGRIVNAFKQLNDVFTCTTRFQIQLSVLFLSVYHRRMSCNENGPFRFANICWPFFYVIIIKYI